MNNPDFDRYPDFYLRNFINLSWQMIETLAKGYEQPLGTLHFDLTDALSQCMIEASDVLFKRDQAKAYPK